MDTKAWQLFAAVQAVEKRGDFNSNALTLFAAVQAVEKREGLIDSGDFGVCRRAGG